MRNEGRNDPLYLVSPDYRSRVCYVPRSKRTGVYVPVTISCLIDCRRYIDLMRMITSFSIKVLNLKFEICIAIVGANQLKFISF